MSRIRISLAVLLSALLVSAPSTSARADEPSSSPSPFGTTGQLALQLNESFNVNDGDILSGPQIQASYFVADHVSLGLMVGFNWYSVPERNADGMHELVFRIGPRIGFDLPLSEHISFWPQIGADYRSDHQSSGASSTAGSSTVVSSSSSTASSLGLVIVAPLVIHPTRGFFIGAGPSFYTELADSTSAGSGSVDEGKITAIGLMATLGGAF